MSSEESSPRTSYDNGMKPLDRIIDRRLLAAWPLAIIVHVVGNFTGHYQGFYAQSEPAMYLQWALIVMMAAAMLAIAPALDEADENE